MRSAGSSSKTERGIKSRSRATTRGQAERIAGELRDESGVDARHYHAGMKPAERDEIQADFKAGRIEVMVATVAFGMGIDKPNIRFVLHCHAPGSLEAYYQEIGRAGRDGLPARAALFYRPEDMGLRRLAQQRRLHMEIARIEIMKGYAETRRCRRQFLLEYFGETLKKPCGACDNCESGSVVTAVEEGSFPLKSRVTHRDWGEGVVLSADDSHITVLFEHVGRKTLSTRIVIARGLLQKVE